MVVAPRICVRVRDSFKKTENTTAKKMEEFLSEIAKPGAETFKPYKKIKNDAVAKVPHKRTRTGCEVMVALIHGQGALRIP